LSAEIITGDGPVVLPRLETVQDPKPPVICAAAQGCEVQEQAVAIRRLERTKKKSE
jgi:hypothetical protein